MNQELKNSKMEIWNSVCTTDPQFTKSFQRGTTHLTDINPAYRLRRLTELFGPAGKEWGWTLHERWREEWNGVQCAFVMLSIWYIDDDGNRCETPPQVGGTVAGDYPDEIWKMSITDAVGKCCMSLGISADVYLGVFDGKYRQSAPAQRPPVSPPPTRTPPAYTTPSTKTPPVHHDPLSSMQAAGGDQIPF